MRIVKMTMTGATLAAAIAAGALATGAGATDPAAGDSDPAAAPGDRVTFEKVAGGAAAPGVRAAQSFQAGPAQLANTYRLVGTAENDDFVITVSQSGRFVIRSRARAITPISPPLGCQVDNSHQVSCNPGLVESFVARLKRGRDVFIARRHVRIPIFVSGGRGPDRLIAGDGNAVLRGLAGADQLVGNGGRNLLVGGRGRDFLVSGPKRNKVRGGKGHDICVDNRRGENTFRSCEVIRRR